ncbi:MAG: pantoate--beta-alanine ligase [Desulfovibrionaceae bacterium]|nr:pantoate--beta-alanine ligase [Desulfovibrionaceae bacterium]
MNVITTPADLRLCAQEAHAKGQTIALVPTMGYFHAGHEDLIRHGRSIADLLIVSLFVNPTQFGPAEDLDRYPRDHERDSQIAKNLGCDVLFMPDPPDMYPKDFATWVEVPSMSKLLCGAARPIHFRGVCTVLTKLFNLSAADFAVFGEKDWQQQAIVKRMVKDLNIPINIQTRPTVRESDGLALSSRNVYLSKEERLQAPNIYAGLKWAQNLVSQGERNVEIIRSGLLNRWASQIPLGRLDYLTVVDPASLTPISTIEGPAVMACAIRLGTTRLIDNIMLNA